jgi:tRNA (cytidine/uridine-2'-O-)-methyltransferase
MNIVLVNPEIPFNTGNIGRTCVATGTMLHLAGRLGFKINDKEIRRSGLDYWPKLKYSVHKTFEDFLAEANKINAAPSPLKEEAEKKAGGSKPQLFFFSTKGKKSLWDIKFEKDDYLIFGSESCGFPGQIYADYKDSLYRIPMRGDARSLNLSSSAAICLYEALRQTGFK